MTDTAYKKAMADAAAAYAEAVAAAAEVDDPVEPAPDTPRFNAAAFYDVIRETLFGGSLNQGQVDGHQIIGTTCVYAGLDPLLQQSAYVFATVYHETARTMQPIEEYGGWNTRYAPWFGRGYVQLTWEENYEKQQNKLGNTEVVTLYDIPWRVHDDYNLALTPSTSALITVGGMRDGDFTGKALRDYITSGSVDYVNARRIVNGTDRAEQIASYAQAYETALRIGWNG